jgi:SAM-dependent methyltransferase
MSERFLESYFGAFDRIEGWLSPDASLMFMAYNEVIAAHGIAGDVLEIGVHHGLSSLALAAMRRDGAQLVAIDLFDELQACNVSASGSGSRARFERNLREFFGDIAFLRCIEAPSNTVGPADLGSGFSFCHVDGGHTARETYEDLDLCSRILLPGGLLALDDYFNPAFPGVCEGAIKFWLEHDGALTPIAVGFNKVLFQKTPVPFDLNAAFTQRFEYIPHKTTTLWEAPVHSFSSFAAFIDLRASSPHGLRANESFRMDASLSFQTDEVTAQGGGTICIPVRVVNRSTIPFVAGTGAAPFGLSYHLLSDDGGEVRFNNARSYFRLPLAPEEERIVDLSVDVPRARGSYTVEADIIWEGITWLKDRGLDTPSLKLLVI